MFLASLPGRMLRRSRNNGCPIWRYTSNLGRYARKKNTYTAIGIKFEEKEVVVCPRETNVAYPVILNEGIHRYVGNFYVEESQRDRAVWSPCDPVWVILPPVTQLDRKIDGSGGTFSMLHLDRQNMRIVEGRPVAEYILQQDRVAYLAPPKVNSFARHVAPFADGVSALHFTRNRDRSRQRCHDRSQNSTPPH